MYPWRTAPPAGTHEIQPVEDVFLTLDKWPEQAYRPHYHDAFNWLVPLRPGQMKIDIEGHDLRIGMNSWVCVFPNTPHAVYEVSDGMEILALFFTHEEMHAALESLGIELIPSKPYIFGNQGSIAQGLALQWAGQRMREPRCAELASLFTPFLCTWLWKFYPAGTNVEEGLEVLLHKNLQGDGGSIFRFIQKYLAESPFPWEMLASDLGVSQRTLQRRITDRVGMTPSELLAIGRIERAKILLRDDLMPLAKVALECGYSSQSHFSAAFKTATGHSPRQYSSRSR
jgi:AraC-like DNA-binding protein